MRIGDFDTDRRVLIVAEIGNNHEGDARLAEQLVHLAAEAGADAVKFQTFRTPEFVSPRDRDRYNRLRSFELAPAEFERLGRTAAERGLLFLSTPLDLGSVEVLDPLIAAFKIASGDNTFYPLLEKVAATGKPVLLSTGLASLEQVERARLCLARVWGANARPDLALLHCVSSYPVPAEEANLSAICLLADAFDCTVGYSDHTVGIEAVAAAVALGARVVEKHFTIDKNYSSFRDHQLSADPAELRTLVERVRLVETLLGSGGKVVQAGERAGLDGLRRSIVARRDLPAGALIEIGDLNWVRPAGGLPPGEEHRLVGRKLREPVTAGDPIHVEMVAP
ncbi:MAG: N-acetylneuraminate synthase family protein [Planctomycetota bacterium]|jgi:sialic acid synthase SpsE